MPFSKLPDVEPTLRSPSKKKPSTLAFVLRDLEAEWDLGVVGDDDRVPQPGQGPDGRPGAPGRDDGKRERAGDVEVVCLVNIDSLSVVRASPIPLSSVSDIRHRPEEKKLTAAATSTLIDRRPTEAGPAGRSK